MNNCPHIKIQLLLNSDELLIENYDFFFFLTDQERLRGKIWEQKKDLMKHNVSVDIS